MYVFVLNLILVVCSIGLFLKKEKLCTQNMWNWQFVGVEGDLTPLQKHVSFFDRNKDGIIYPLETYQGYELEIENIIVFNFYNCNNS